MTLIIDIHSQKKWPACQLSNFAPAQFSLDGLTFQCMEGFLQSLKDPIHQAEYQYLDAKTAKQRGSQIHWQRSGYLFWNGTAFRRTDWAVYRTLLSRAYDALLENSPEFSRALLATGHCFLWHSVGKLSRHQTCLTTFEFLSMLYRVRRIARRRQKKKA